MDASRFDAWTRRRFGTAAAGIVAGVLGLAADGELHARKKKRRKQRKRKCEKLGTRCNPNNDKQLCCSGLFCQKTPELDGNRCCKPMHAPCSRDADCCRNLACRGATSLSCRDVL